MNKTIIYCKNIFTTPHLLILFMVFVMCLFKFNVDCLPFYSYSYIKNHQNIGKITHTTRCFGTDQLQINTLKNENYTSYQIPISSAVSLNVLARAYIDKNNGLLCLKHHFPFIWHCYDYEEGQIEPPPGIAPIISFPKEYIISVTNEHERSIEKAQPNQNLRIISGLVMALFGIVGSIVGIIKGKISKNNANIAVGLFLCNIINLALIPYYSIIEFGIINVFTCLFSFIFMAKLYKCKNIYFGLSLFLLVYMWGCFYNPLSFIDIFVQKKIIWIFSFSVMLWMSLLFHFSQKQQVSLKK
jgi:hypothetical protein